LVRERSTVQSCPAAPPKNRRNPRFSALFSHPAQGRCRTLADEHGRNIAILAGKAAGKIYPIGSARGGRADGTTFLLYHNRSVV
jgi:hypothetical protein